MTSNTVKAIIPEECDKFYKEGYYTVCSGDHVINSKMMTVEFVKDYFVVATDKSFGVLKGTSFGEFKFHRYIRNEKNEIIQVVRFNKLLIDFNDIIIEGPVAPYGGGDYPPKMAFIRFRYDMNDENKEMIRAYIYLEHIFTAACVLATISTDVTNYLKSKDVISFSTDNYVERSGGEDPVDTMYKRILFCTNKGPLNSSEMKKLDPDAWKTFSQVALAKAKDFITCTYMGVMCLTDLYNTEVKAMTELNTPSFTKEGKPRKNCKFFQTEFMPKMGGKQRGSGTSADILDKMNSVDYWVIKIAVGQRNRTGQIVPIIVTNSKSGKGKLIDWADMDASVRSGLNVDIPDLTPEKQFERKTNQERKINDWKSLEKYGDQYAELPMPVMKTKDSDRVSFRGRCTLDMSKVGKGPKNFRVHLAPDCIVMLPESISSDYDPRLKHTQTMNVEEHASGESVFSRFAEMEAQVQTKNHIKDDDEQIQNGCDE